MIRIILLICFFSGPALYAQPVIKDTLLTLNKPVEVVHKYVNFDVAKIMFCRGTASHLTAPNGWNLSLRLQYLYPYSKFKKVFPVAVGAVVGYDKMSIRSRRFVFTNDKLDLVTPDPAVRKSTIWWYYAGFVAAPVVRLEQFTLLPGASFNLNFGGMIKTKTTDKNKTVSKVKNLKWFSVPIFLQISYSKKQFASFGAYIGFYKSPVPTDNTFKKMKQFSLGLTGALIF
jgi:hypothetical protein